MNDSWDSDGESGSRPIASQQFINRDRNRNSGSYGDNQRGQKRGEGGGGSRDGGRRGDDRSDNGRQEDGLVIQVEQSKVGKLIGRGGSKIKELQDCSGARINIDKSSGNAMASVTLVGSEESQMKAKELIDELMNGDRQYPDQRNRQGRFDQHDDYQQQQQQQHQDQYQQQWQPQSDAGQGYSDGNWQNGQNGRNNENPEGDLVIQVEYSKVGKLIGRGGCKIKELQDSSGARINIDKNSGGGTAAVTLVGSEEAQQRARQLIDELVNEDRQYGEQRNNGQNGYEQQNQQQAYYLVDDAQAMNWQQSGGGGGNIDNGQGEEMVIEVDQSKIGKLIGRGGCKIKELQDNSGARINVNKSGSGPASVTLVGSEVAQRKAKEMIDELMSEDRQYGGQQSYRSEGFDQQPHDNYQSNQHESAPAVDFTQIDWQEANKRHEEYQREQWANLDPMIKNFYQEDPAVANMSEEHVARFRRQNNNIECRRVFEKAEGEEDNFTVPNPVESFEQAFHNYPDILEEIRKQGFEKPSPIQCQAWPILLSGKDMIGIAQTGTGKTLAFLLPALIHIDGQPVPREQREGPNVLVMAPTRELALQIAKEVRKYTYRGIKAVCLYGGGNRKEQMDACFEGVQIVIATPGRLNDLLNSGALKVSSVTYLVLDEADRMLDMGFEPQIRLTLLRIRPDRQTVMTSATWPQGVRRLAQSYMKDPIQVFVGSLDLAAVHSVRQTINLVEEVEKSQMLYQFFRNMGENDKVIVFIGKKSRVDDLASSLALQNIPCQSIHGGRDQWDREQALMDIKEGSVKILLATDVASRGIDIEDITHVFNYDFPRDIEEYVHRVGRTGRAGRTGESISLMTRQDWSHAKKLIEILEEASQEIPQELYKMSERYDAMKVKRAQEKEQERMDGGGYGGGRDRYGGGGGGRDRYGGGDGGRDRYGGGGGRGPRGGSRW